MPRLFPTDRVPDNGLNAQQRSAVNHGDGPFLVVAGAGTGKTRVIIARIRHLLETQPELSGENILGLTYTEKAANEMKSRIVAEVGERAKSVTLSTFHSFCNDILMEQDPSVIAFDEPEHWIFLRRKLRQLELKLFLKAANPGKFLSDFVKFFSRCQDELVTPADYQSYVDGLAARLEREKDTLDADSRAERETEVARQREVARAYAVSERLLAEAKRRTYGGMLMQAVQELHRNSALLNLLRQRYRYILVDEFQDTNIAQIELLELLAGEDRNIVAVGDDDQAIYRWRGASFGSFQLFVEKFIGAKVEPGKPPQQAVLLNQNYRSTKRILRVAHKCIAMNADRMFPDKQLTTEHAEGEKIRVVSFDHKIQEAHWIAADIEGRHREGKQWHDFAVLYRAHTHNTELIAALTSGKIPFVIKNRTILRNPIVRDVLAHLRLVGNLSDNVACGRVLAIPYWGLEASDVVRLAERAAKGRGMSLWDALTQSQGELPFAAAQKRTGELVDWITSLVKQKKRLTTAELMDQLTAGMGLSMMPGGTYREALDRLRKFVEEWQKKSDTRLLPEFLEYFEYFQEAGGKLNFENEPEGDAVQLMTVHAAKGLEFPHVYVVRLVDRSFPAKEKEPELEFPVELLKDVLPQTQYHIQEERRLFYVALTRAKRSLTLSTVINKWSKQSIFVHDVLDDPRIKKEDVHQLAPQAIPVEEDRQEASADALRMELFGPDALNVRAFSKIGEWGRTYRPPLYDPLQLSASAIEYFERCPQAYLFASQWGLRGGPQATMTFGSVMHLAVKEFVAMVSQSRRVSFEDLEGIYQREWRTGAKAGFRDEVHEEEYKKAGLEQLRMFYDSYTQAPSDVVAQEKKFELPMENNIVVEGRIDQINRLNKTEVEIVDYKTGTPKDEKASKRSLQLSIYALAVKDVFEWDPAKLVFHNFSNNERAESARTKKDLEKAQTKVQEVAGDIRAANFPAKAGFICNYCDFRLICPEHQE